MTLSVHGTSNYTGIRTSHVFRPGIEPGSTAWKSRTLTTQPVTHILYNTSYKIQSGLVIKKTPLGLRYNTFKFCFTIIVLTIITNKLAQVSHLDYKINFLSISITPSTSTNSNSLNHFNLLQGFS